MASRAGTGVIPLFRTLGMGRQWSGDIYSVLKELVSISDLVAIML